MPIFLAQVPASEIAAVSDGLSKGGLSFVAAVLGFIVWGLYRENRDLRADLLKAAKDATEVAKKDNEDKIELVKEILPLANKLADAVPALERVANKLTQE